MGFHHHGKSALINTLNQTLMYSESFNAISIPVAPNSRAGDVLVTQHQHYREEAKLHLVLTNTPGLRNPAFYQRKENPPDDTTLILNGLVTENISKAWLDEKFKVDAVIMALACNAALTDCNKVGDLAERLKEDGYEVVWALTKLDLNDEKKLPVIKASANVTNINFPIKNYYKAKTRDSKVYEAETMEAATGILLQALTFAKLRRIRTGEDH